MESLKSSYTCILALLSDHLPNDAKDEVYLIDTARSLNIVVRSQVNVCIPPKFNCLSSLCYRSHGGNTLSDHLFQKTVVWLNQPTYE